MASKKATKLFKELEAKRQQALEIEKLVQLTIEEDKAKLEQARKEIDLILEKYDLFCGARLNSSEVAKLIQFAIDSKDDIITISYNLYFNP